MARSQQVLGGRIVPLMKEEMRAESNNKKSIRKEEESKMRKCNGEWGDS